MQISVSQLLRAPIGTTASYEVAETVDIAGSESIVQGEVELVHTDRGILVEGTVQSTIKVACSRCLSLFSYPLALGIEEEYLATTDVVTGARLSLPEEPDYLTIDERYVLDLNEAIRQYMLLAIPMKPLCGEGCAGLCPDCGHNLNEGACDCLSKEVDPIGLS
jgi:uncharacterized protein